jgi:hypothetical protein
MSDVTPAKPDETWTPEKYAGQLALGMARKFYPDAPQFEPMTGDIMGLISQIDNMQAGLVRAPIAGSLAAIVARVEASMHMSYAGGWTETGMEATISKQDWDAVKAALSPTKQEETPVAPDDTPTVNALYERLAVWAKKAVREHVASPSVSREAIRAEAFEEAAQWAAAAAVTGVQLGWDASATGDHVVASIRARALSAPEHGERTI